ncbi:MAG: hypothetical protein NC310_03210 [Roseburia sp.]|nr:hypothetical protein [Anaeroplasma bactoclasticum]MCM1196068.1 hypothetical protein [Roseburia sp.]
MSQQVTVDYQGISIQVQAQCDTAVHSLCNIDKTLDRIHETASKLETSKVKKYEEYLMKSKKTIKDKIEAFKATLEKYKDAKAYSINNHQPQYSEFLKFTEQVQRESRELTNIVNELTGSKLAVIDQMIDEGLLNAGQESVQNLLNKMNGVVNFSESLISQINAISDVSLRELAYRELVKSEGKTTDFNSILSKAQEEYNALIGKKTTQVIEEYKQELKSQGLSTDAIANASTIDEANQVVNAAITDEKIRKETLKIIIKAINARGFIVDTKKNLKIDRERNIVKLVALKASGQMAEFEIQLNGKFMYHFDEYEGHACKKDIAPFLEDLKNVYDIDITHEEVTWENPDKIQTQKYQYVNKNKGTN